MVEHKIKVTTHTSNSDESKVTFVPLENPEEGLQLL